MLLSNVEGKMPPSTDLLQGTLDMLILKTLAAGPGARLGDCAADPADVEQRVADRAGSLYPALHRLEYQAAGFGRSGALRKTIGGRGFIR